MSDRNLDEVLAAMLEVIPFGEVDLRRKLTYIVATLPYQPPEIHQDWWREATVHVNEYLDGRGPAAGWESEMIAIWMGTDHPQKSKAPA